MLPVVFLSTRRQFSTSKSRCSQTHKYLFGGLWTVSVFSFIMAGCLLFLILMYSPLKIQTQDLLPPKLTVNPPVITETDSVTLNCQTPSSVSVSQCYFHFVRGGRGKSFPCLQTLTGTELLKMSHQSSPAEVNVTCFYVNVYQSPDSDVFSIIIRNLPPPKLTVNLPVITETDSVTLNCQTPSSVSVSQCSFNLGRENTKVFSCMKTLTGTELLKTSRQSLPAEVKIDCFYVEKVGDVNSPSPHSDTSSITIHSQTPKISLQHFQGKDVLFICSLPGSADHDTRCNLYFGESSHPVQTTTIGKKMTSKNQWICQFIVTIEDLLRRLRSVQQSNASCDYTLRSEPNSLSRRSDGYSLTDIVKKESSFTQTMSTLSMSTGLTVDRSDPSTSAGWPVDMHSSTVGSTSTSPTPVKPASGVTVYRSGASTPIKLTSAGWPVGTHSSTVFSTSTTPVKPASGSSVSTPSTKDRETAASAEMWIWKFVAVVVGCGVAVAVILLVSVILWRKRRAVTGSVEVNNREQQNENYDTYHLYAAISEEPAEFALKEMVYSTVQPH